MRRSVACGAAVCDCVLAVMLAGKAQAFFHLRVFKVVLFFGQTSMANGATARITECAGSAPRARRPCPVRMPVRLACPMPVTACCDFTLDSDFSTSEEIQLGFGFWLSISISICYMCFGGTLFLVSF